MKTIACDNFCTQRERLIRSNHKSEQGTAKGVERERERDREKGYIGLRPDIFRGFALNLGIRMSRIMM